MKLHDVSKLARQGEGPRIEFKKKATHPEKIIREIIAIANTDGGHLLIGVDDDGTVSGQRYIEDEVYVMDKAIHELIFPPLSISKQVILLNEKKGVAIYEIPKSDMRPHFVMEGAHKKSYVRVEDKSIQASREVWEILKRQKRHEDIVFRYGKKEEVLVKALENKPTITLKEYMALAGLPIYVASRTLVRLVLANVLQVLPRETEDLFIMKPIG